jgi:membrane-associated phospholipid phosphatase
VGGTGLRGGDGRALAAGATWSAPERALGEPIDRLVGSLFLAAALVITVGRVLVGAHYPVDVAAGLLAGFAAASIVVRFGRPLLAPLVRLLSRLTDPLLVPFWRIAPRSSRS